MHHHRHHHRYQLQQPNSFRGSCRRLEIFDRSLDRHFIVHAAVKMVPGTATTLLLLLTGAVGPAAVAAGTLRGKLIRRLARKLAPW